jgi:hypothetical protein
VASFGNLTQTVAAAGYNLALSFNNGQTSGNATTANFSVTAAAAANMTIRMQPDTTKAGTAIRGFTSGTRPMVHVRDAFQNPVSTQNVTVTLQTGSFTGNSTTQVATDAGGNATFTNLVGNTAGRYKLSFATSNLTAVSNEFEIVNNDASTLVLVPTLQSSAQAGIALDPQPVIQIRDSFGNNARRGGVSITVSASIGGIAGTTTVATNSNGTATFSSLALTGSIGNRTLLFSAPPEESLAPVTSSSISLTAGPVASMVISVEPATSFIAGDELTNTGESGFPAVTLADAYGNPVAATVNATGVGFASFGNGSVTSLTTNASTGVAVFPDLMVTQAGSGQRVNFASGNVSVNTRAFDVSPGNPVSMTVTTQPPATIGAGAVLSPNPVVTLRDAYSNAVSLPYNVQVSLGNGTLSGTANVTTTSGVATFTDLSIAQLGNYTLSFRTLGYDPELTTTSNAFSVIDPVASGLAITGIGAIDATTYQIAFTAEQGGNYWIQRTTDLTSGVWTYVSGTAETATTGANTVNVTSPGGTKAFWRLTTQQPVP